MTVPHSILFFFLLLLLSFSSVDGAKKLNEINRRILHQPLFPETSPPPASPDQPFFPETQFNSPPSPSSADVNGGLPIPTATTTTQPSKPGKRIAIVGIVTLGMLSALAFFLYRHNASGTQKLVNGIFREPQPPTTSTFLYMGTVEPVRDSINNSASTGPVNNTSPYRELNSVKRSVDRYRPSPELQPLPPLSKPPPQPSDDNSPSPSSDEECRETAFYTPHGSAISGDDGCYTVAFPRSSGNSNGCSIPHSKRTSRGLGEKPEYEQVRTS